VRNGRQAAVKRRKLFRHTDRRKNSLHKRQIAYALTVLAVLTFTGGALAQEKKPLTNADVVTMVKAGLPESTVVLAIQQSPTAFDLSPQALIRLKSDGVGQHVMDAMLRGPSGPPTAPPVTSAAEVAPRGVTLSDGANRIAMKRSEPNARGSVGGINKAKVKDALNGNHSQLRITTTAPVFELSLAADVYPSDHVALVKLTPKSDRREIETGRAGITDISQGFRKQDRVPITIEELQPQTATGSVVNVKSYRVKVVSPLPPGEYALVYERGYYDFGIDTAR
jgi:hypothetical protein